MDKNFEIIKSMNYGYDNPEAREKLTIDETLVDISSKSVIDVEKSEMISLYASMSVEPKAYSKALDNLRNVKNMNNRISTNFDKRI